MTSFSGTTPTDAIVLPYGTVQNSSNLLSQGLDYNSGAIISGDGTTMIFGDIRDAQGLTGIIGVWTRDGDDWIFQSSFTGSDTVIGDRFGWDYSVSSDGNTLAVSASDATVSGQPTVGAVYMFTRTGTAWAQTQKITPVGADIYSNGGFAASVALSADGSTLAVGFSSDDRPTSIFSGAVRIYTKVSATWTQQAKVVASDGGDGDGLGSSVALSSNGNTLISGALYESTTQTFSGAAYVYTRSGSTWTQQAKLKASTPGLGDYFGFDVRLSSDGSTAIIGAPYGVGKAFAFTRSGSAWTQQRLFTEVDATDVGSTGSGIDYGTSVSVSSDGNTVLVSSPGQATVPYTFNGAVYMYTRSGTTWTRQKKITSTTIKSSEFFGSVVSMSSDASVAIVTCVGDLSPNLSTRIVYLGRPLDNVLYSYDLATDVWYVATHGAHSPSETYVFTSTNTWEIPTGAKVVEVTCIGAGGGGGGGARNVSGDGGGSGGGGAGLSRYLFRAEDIGGADASIAITIGAGGAGGAATASGTTALSGNNGVSGGTTSFGAFLYAYGGANGVGGTTSARTGGAGGLGMFNGNQGGNTSLSRSATVAGAGGGGGGGASFGTGSVPTAFNIAAPSGAGTAGTSNATLKGTGAGGNGRVSTTTTVSAAGAGGLYGGGGAGGGEGSTAGATGAGGAGGAGASGACIVRVWYG
jgi:hypothetical protein